MEHSNNTIANVCVGVVMVRLVCTAPELFFRYSAGGRAAYMNPIEQQMRNHAADRAEPDADRPRTAG